MEWTVREQGPRAVVEVRRRDDGAGLYKACASGPSGRCPLGTLLPEQGELRLRRVLSIDGLRRQGCWPVERVETELAWPAREGAVRWDDEVLRRSARRLPRFTLRREGEGFSLIFPFDPRSPFPLTPAFCFARVEHGRLIFSFRKGGIPYIPRRPGNNREEVEAQGGRRHGEPDDEGAPRAGGPAGL